MSLVTLAQFRFRARVSPDIPDADLQPLLDDAEDTVFNYLKEATTPWEDVATWTTETLPGDVRHAIIRVAQLMLDFTTAESDTVNFIDEAVQELLRRHRDHALK